MTHIRHIKVPPKIRGSKFDAAEEARKWNVELRHIYNPIIQVGDFDNTNKFIDEKLQNGMNTYYEYIIT